MRYLFGVGNLLARKSRLAMHQRFTPTLPAARFTPTLPAAIGAERCERANQITQFAKQLFTGAADKLTAIPVKLSALEFSKPHFSAANRPVKNRIDSTRNHNYATLVPFGYQILNGLYNVYGAQLTDQVMNLLSNHYPLFQSLYSAGMSYLPLLQAKVAASLADVTLVLVFEYALLLVHLYDRLYLKKIERLIEAIPQELMDKLGKELEQTTEMMFKLNKEAERAEAAGEAAGVEDRKLFFKIADDIKTEMQQIREVMKDMDLETKTDLDHEAMKNGEENNHDGDVIYDLIVPVKLRRRESF